MTLSAPVPGPDGAIIRSSGQLGPGQSRKHVHNPYQECLAGQNSTGTEHADPMFLPSFLRYWVNRETCAPEAIGWTLAINDITRTTNVRTMIAAVVPKIGCGYTLPMLLPLNR